MRLRHFAVFAAAILLAGRSLLPAQSPAQTTLPVRTLPRGMQLEAPCPSGMTKIVLVAGSNFFKPGQHEYIGGCAVLADLLRQTPGVFPVLALDWPTAETFEGAKSVVFFLDGGDKHAVLQPDKLAAVQKLAAAGAGLVSFHQGVDVPKDLGDAVRDLYGAAFEKGPSQRAHWVAEFKTFPDHSICRGVTPFTIDDGWLFKLRFVPGMRGISPLLRTVSPKASKADEPGDGSIVSWAYDRPSGGRSFTFTGCHLHKSLAEEGYRRYLTNGILWTAGVDVPSTGARVALDTTQLDSYLDPPAKDK